MMQRTIIILLCSIFHLGAFSQTKDSVLVSVHYIAHFHEYVEQSEETTDEMILDILTGQTAFYSRWKQKRDEIADSVLHQAHGNFYDVIEEQRKYPRGRVGWRIYTNTPQKGERLVTDQIFKTFYYTEKIEPVQWKLLDKDTTIIEYPCHAASCSFRGHQWTVYYTQEIPFSVGPWKLSGLPGVILYAYDHTSKCTFEGIEVRKGSRIFKMPDLKKVIKSSRDELQQMHIEDAKDPIAFSKKRFGFDGRGYGSDGKPLVYKPKTPIFLED